jgi:hypothetical protein
VYGNYDSEENAQNMLLLRKRCGQMAAALEP